MPPTAPSPTILQQIALVFLIVIPLTWFALWFVWQYVKSLRAYRAGRGDEPMAWLRKNHPNHAALPPAPPKPVLRELPRRWSAWTLLIYVAQAGAIAGLIWVFLGRAEPVPPPLPSPLAVAMMFFLAVILVALATAALTSLSDLMARLFRQVARPASRRAHGEQPRQEELSGRAPATLAEKPQQRVGRQCGNGRPESLPFHSLPCLAAPCRA